MQDADFFLAQCGVPISDRFAEFMCQPAKKIKWRIIFQKGPEISQNDKNTRFCQKLWSKPICNRFEEFVFQPILQIRKLNGFRKFFDTDHCHKNIIENWQISENLLALIEKVANISKNRWPKWQKRQKIPYFAKKRATTCYCAM